MATISQMLFRSSRQSLTVTRLCSFTQSRSKNDNISLFDHWEETDDVPSVSAHQVTVPKWREERNKRKYNEWRPKKRLTRSEMEHLRHMHNVLPQENSIAQLAKKFKISSSAVIKILQSKFEPSDEVRERQDRRAMKQKEQRKIDRELGNSGSSYGNTNDDSESASSARKRERYSWTDLE